MFFSIEPTNLSVHSPESIGSRIYALMTVLKGIAVYKRQLYMFYIPSGYTDGFIQWCKQIIGLCLTTFLQATILTAGLLVLKDHALLGLCLLYTSRCV